MKNMFGGDSKAKKDQKLLDTTIKTISASDKKEKIKYEACIKLIEILESSNSNEININFESLLTHVEYLAESIYSQFKKTWLLVNYKLSILIIKFRPDYRGKLFAKIMKIVFELDNEETALKLRVIQCATNCCLNVQEIDIKILIEFLTFECLLFEEFQKEYLFVMILNLLISEYFKFSKFLIEFIVDCMGQICMKRFALIGELETPGAVEEQIKFIKIIFQFFELYMKFFIFKKIFILKNIVKVYCLIVNYDREYSWKIMKDFLQTESKNIVKIFLEIVYNKEVNNKYCDLEDYFYYDNDEEFGLTSYFDKIYFLNSIYKKFVEKLGDLNEIIKSLNPKVIKGSVFFIGMSLWSLEKIEMLEIPNTIILSHFCELIKHSDIKTNQEIIVCLNRLIKKNGETLTDEWEEIFSIILKISLKDKNSFKDNIIKNLFDIFESIKMLIIQDKFFGSYSDFIQVLDEFKIFHNESLMMTKCRLKLCEYQLFVANLESVIIEYLLNSKSDRVRNYLMEIIRLNYSFTFNVREILKKSIIENLITKHFPSIIIALENAENLNFFSLLITEITVLTNNFDFFDKIIRLIFNIHNEFRLYSNVGERSKFIWNFQTNTLINIFNKLSCTFQSEKLNLFNKKIYQLMKNKGDISILITVLNFFKNFIVNNDYELFIKDNLIYKNRYLPSQMVINYKPQNSVKQKKNEYQKRINIYEPYIVFKHNKVYDFLIDLINRDETNTFIYEEVLEFLLKNLKTTFFYKALKLDKLLNTILAIDEIKKYATRRRFIDLIVDILVNTTFHLNSNTLVINDTLLNNYINNISLIKHYTIKEFSIEMPDDILKEKIIQFSLNSLKSFVFILKNILNTYRKMVTAVNNSQNVQSQRQESIKVNHFDPNTATTTVNLNSITDSLDNTVNSPLSINFKMDIYYIKKMLNLISIYFCSIQSIPNSDEINTKNLSNIYSSNNKQLPTIFPQQNKKLMELVNFLVDILIDMRNLIFFKSSLGISIIHLIMSIKDVVIPCGEDIIIKIIFLLLNIAWPNYENEILKSFSDNFSIKFKKFDPEKIRPVEKHLKREYVNILADICCFYYIEKSSQGKVIWNILNTIFKVNNNNLNSSSRTHGSVIRESIFLDNCKWQIYSKTNRDNIKAEFRSKIPINSQVYFGKQSIIMLIPINKSSSEVIIRNSISNINITLNYNLENKNEIEELEAMNILNNIEKCTDGIKIIQTNPLTNVQDTDSPKITTSKLKLNSSGNINLVKSHSNVFVSPVMKISNCEEFGNYIKERTQTDASLENKFLTIYDLNNDHKGLRRRDCSPNLYVDIKKENNSKTSSALPVKDTKENSRTSDKFIQNLNNLIGNSNIIFKQITNLLCEQEIKLQNLEINSQLEDDIMNLDSIPVYYTYTCGVMYVPSKHFSNEFDILSYEGELSQPYIKFLYSLGKVFSIVDNPHIHTGGLDKSGADGKYSIYYQDSIFQIVYHVTNLIKLEKKENSFLGEGRNYLNELFNIRKRFIGNAFVNVVWLDNPYQEFDTNTIISGASLIYIVIHPISESYYLIKIKYNKRTRFNLIDKISVYYIEDLCVNLNEQNLSKVLMRLIIQFNIMISYILQKTVFRKVEIDELLNIDSTPQNFKQTNQFNFESNIAQRFKEIERINCRFKNSNL